MIEPLKKLRLTCDAKEQGITFDLTWNASFPAHEEPQHQTRVRERDHPRRGPLRAGGHVGGVDEGRRPGVGGVARHVGRRPRPLVGHPAGRRAARRPGAPTRPPGGRSFWWLYTPTRFDDFFLFVIAQEDGDGNRGINEAVRMWPDGRIEQLGWPEVEITYRSGHASSGTRGDAPPRREPQAVRRRVRDARVRRDRARRGLRRRRLDPRSLDGPRDGSTG